MVPVHASHLGREARREEELHVGATVIEELREECEPSDMTVLHVPAQRSSNGSSLWQSITGQLRGPHPLFTFPPPHPWLLVVDLAQTDDDPLFLLKRHRLSSAYPATMLTRRTSIVSALLPSPCLPVAKLSASFSQKWYPARRHAPFKSQARWMPETIYWKRFCKRNHRSLHLPAFSSKLSSRARAAISPSRSQVVARAVCRCSVWFRSRLEVFSSTLAT